MIDTHTHLYFREDYPDGGREAVERALESGVELMVLPNVGPDTADALLKLHHDAPRGATEVAVGLHPEYIDADWRAKIRAVFDRFADENPVAVGEVGIDLYHEAGWKIQQMDAFGEQLQIAREMSLPVIVHSRNALDETLEVLGMMGADLPVINFHSFTGGREDMERILREVPDARFGINGVVTFKNAPELRDAVREMPADRILLETDSPYLAPVPKRGRTNESSYLGFINEKIAELKGVPADAMAALTTRNALKFFGK